MVVILVVAAVGTTLALQNSGSNHAAGGTGTTTSTSGAPAKALSVVSTTPTPGAANVPTDIAITVQLSAPLSAATPMPTLSPAVAGTWKKVGNTTLSFAAAAPLIPSTSETLTVPGGATGVRDQAGSTLATPVTVSFTVAQGSTTRLQQLLAQLNYLPVSFTPSAPLTSPAEAANPQAGSFAWRWTTLPASLTSLWTQGQQDIITKGAVMAFQNQNGLSVDGVAGAQVWTTLLADVTAAKVDTNPYVYVYVSKTVPQTLTLYNNGAPQFSNIPVNTGAPGADTADGTYPVFEHVPSSEMKGTNPDGSTYDDPAVPWASYFNGGDALHGFPRATYGSPQSNGCVEMAISDAAQVWPLTPIGTLVTVVGPTI
ncbi:MAG TPA: L,D-transpeptidase family protein [Acidimicrobiales bacterium]|nr:L,D-transpeptidase family protein [Acidimicrobiales bacterium]